MNVKRFTARTSRDALMMVRQAFGDDAVVLSTKPCAEGVEVMAMAPESVEQIERVSASTVAAAMPKPVPGKVAARVEPRMQPGVEEDVQQLAMSTLSFQGYVRERMLRRRQEALRAEATQAGESSERVAGRPRPTGADFSESRMGTLQERLAQRNEAPVVAAPAPTAPPVRHALPVQASAPRAAAPRAQPQAQPQVQPQAMPVARAEHAAAQREQQAMMHELREVKGLIEERFGALAFMDKLQRHPAQARLTQKLLDCGFSPMLIRKLAESMPPSVTDEIAWASGILERNILTGERELALEDQGGVFALVGSTGVGKTTSTAKIAAAFAAKHGAGHLGLVTLDAYRVGAHEQLRAYGRILGVPVHTAHDRASLDDLLDLLSGKKMVLIDTAGMAQRDTRTAELLDMLSHRSINRLLVLNAASQGETLEDVIVSYRAAQARGVILSKMDEAVKLGPALDAAIRHKLTVLGVANGQRVPEDWHRLSAQVLLHRALRGGAWSAYKHEAPEVNLIFTARQQADAGTARPAR